MNKRKLPPYAKHLDPEKLQSIAMLTGTGAWERAKAACWFDGAKLVLPYGEDPRVFRWPVAGRDCIVYSSGDPEPHEHLIALSAELVLAGALFVIWCADFVDLEMLTDDEFFQLGPPKTPAAFFPGMKLRRAA